MRTQICSTDKNKVRSVIGYPLECFLEEGRYLYPIMQAFTDNKFGDPPIAYGLEMAKGGMEYMNHMVTDERVQYIGMLDWSSFDKLVPPWLIKDAFAILRGLFDFTKVVDEDGIVHEVKDPQEIENRWNKVIKYFIDTPVRLSDGSRFRKEIDDLLSLYPNYDSEEHANIDLELPDTDFPEGVNCPFKPIRPRTRYPY
ncbi:hypothetical protein WDU94_015544 [Cyamophila willieti]